MKPNTSLQHTENQPSILWHDYESQLILKALNIALCFYVRFYVHSPIGAK
jgi:hypothetical protein